MYLKVLVDRMAGSETLVLKDQYIYIQTVILFSRRNLGRAKTVCQRSSLILRELTIEKRI